MVVENLKTNTTDKVAVCSRSFSRNAILREELSRNYENVTFNDEGKMLHSEALVNFLKGHTKAIVGLEHIDEWVLSKVPELEVISKYGVGLDGIDTEAMRRHGKKLGWKGGVNRRSVAELVVGFMIVILREVSAASNEVVRGIWRPHIGRLLGNATVGIIGCGFVGKEVVKLLEPFGCRILVNDIKYYGAFYEQHRIEPVSLEELLARSDIVTLHVPLDSSTRNLLSGDRIGLIKNGGVVINSARGYLVDEEALKHELKKGRLLGAAFDVFATEPADDKELLELPNFLATPHIGGSTEEATLAMGRAAIAGLDECSLVTGETSS